MAPSPGGDGIHAAIGVAYEDKTDSDGSRSARLYSHYGGARHTDAGARSVCRRRSVLVDDRKWQLLLERYVAGGEGEKNRFRQDCTRAPRTIRSESMRQSFRGRGTGSG
jgi:hypothetical protein